MKKLLLAIGTLLPLALLAPAAHAADYSYDCLCLYSDSRGTCVQYTCDSYQRPSYYRGGCDRYRSDSGCRYGYDNRYGYNNNYGYYNNYNYSNSQYYDSRYNYDWYYRRYTGNSPSRRYYNQYYDAPMYYY